MNKYDAMRFSNFSDGKFSIPEIVDLYGSRGFGSIAITDHLCEDRTIIGKASAYLGKTLTHASFPLYREILKSEANRAWRQYRMLLVPGFELTRNSILNHRSSHILALGVNEWISASLSVEEICAQIHDLGGLAVAAHPVPTGNFEKQTLYLWGKRDEYAKHFDAWEVSIGKRLFPEVMESGLPMIANSDFHRREHFESWKSLLYCEQDFQAMKYAIRTQNMRLKYVSDEGDLHESILDRITHQLDLRGRTPGLGRGYFPASL